MLARRQAGRDGSLITLSLMAYDTAGQFLFETNALGGVTASSQTRDSLGQTVKFRTVG